MIGHITQATSRIRKNMTYFKVNYVLFVLGMLILCLLTHPLSMFLLLGASDPVTLSTPFVGAPHRTHKHP